MTILTVATILIALPNVIFGMYGMNVRLPFESARWAFEAIVGLNLFIHRAGDLHRPQKTRNLDFSPLFC